MNIKFQDNRAQYEVAFLLVAQGIAFPFPTPSGYISISQKASVSAGKGASAITLPIVKYLKVRSFDGGQRGAAPDATRTDRRR